jgi:hypothetical protein
MNQYPLTHANRKKENEIVKEILKIVIIYNKTSEIRASKHKSRTKKKMSNIYLLWITNKSNHKVT